MGEGQRWGEAGPGLEDGEKGVDSILKFTGTRQAENKLSDLVRLCLQKILQLHWAGDRRGAAGLDSTEGMVSSGESGVPFGRTLCAFAACPEARHAGDVGCGSWSAQGLSLLWWEAWGRNWLGRRGM